MSQTNRTAPMEPLLTVGEVARALRVSDDTIRRRIADGTLAAVRIGSVSRIPAAELDRLGGTR